MHKNIKSRPIKISVCVIAKNEEANIGRCLESVKRAADQIILVDTGSEDETVNIARGFGAEIYNFPWKDDFAAARNFALEQAKGDWIVFLDADEYFPEQVRDNIRKLIARVHHNRNIDCIRTKIVNFLREPAEIGTTAWVVRIFRNHRSIRYRGKIHEAVMKNGKPMISAKAEDNILVLHHTGYTVDKVTEKHKRYKDMLQRKIENGEKGPMDYYYLGECCFGLGEYKKSIEYLDISLGEEKLAEGWVLNPHLYKIKAMLNCSAEYPLSCTEEYVRSILTNYPDHPELHFLLGDVLHRQGKLDLALPAYFKALKCQEEYKGILNNQFNSLIGDTYRSIARILYRKGDFIDALTYLFNSLKTNKYDRNAFRLFADIIRSQPAEEAVYMLKLIYDENNGKDMDFLAEQLADFRLGKILLYYSKRLREESGRKGFYNAVIFLTNGYFDNAYVMFKEQYGKSRDTGIGTLMLAAAFLSGNRVLLEDLAVLTGLRQHRIAAGMLNGSGMLDNSDEELFKAFLQEVVWTGSEEQIDAAIGIKKLFNRDVSMIVGDVLMENRLFPRAVEQYLTALDKGQGECRGKVFNRLGICYYYMHETDSSLEAFRRAAEFGESGCETAAFLSWLLERCKDRETGIEINRLIEKVRQQP